MSEKHTLTPHEIVVQTNGYFGIGIQDYARTKVWVAARHLRPPVLAVRVRLVRHRDPAVALPINAQVNMDVRGRSVHAGVDAHTAREAVDLLEARLRRALEHSARPRGHRSHGRVVELRPADLESEVDGYGEPVADLPDALDQRMIMIRNDERD